MFFLDMSKFIVNLLILFQESYSFQAIDLWWLEIKTNYEYNIFFHIFSTQIWMHVKL